VAGDCRTSKVPKNGQSWPVFGQIEADCAGRNKKEGLVHQTYLVKGLGLTDPRTLEALRVEIWGQARSHSDFYQSLETNTCGNKAMNTLVGTERSCYVKEELPRIWATDSAISTTASCLREHWLLLCTISLSSMSTTFPGASTGSVGIFPNLNLSFSQFLTSSLILSTVP
jgi:hypothetical protein